jgi:hypothetical protein
MELSTDLLKTLALKQHLGEPFFFVEDSFGETFAIEEDKNEIKELYLKAFPEGSEETEDFQTFESWCIHNYSSLEPYESENYLVLTDYEADDALDEALEQYIDKCILYNLPEQYRNYFDRDAWKSDALKSDAHQDGRGHSLASYDGEEHEETVNGKTFYIYHLN